MAEDAGTKHRNTGCVENKHTPYIHTCRQVCITVSERLYKCSISIKGMSVFRVMVRGGTQTVTHTHRCTNLKGSRGEGVGGGETKEQTTVTLWHLYTDHTGNTHHVQSREYRVQTYKV